MILEIFAFLCLIGAVGLLVTLSVIDLKIGLLPNIHNAVLAVFGMTFHALTSFMWLNPQDILVGALFGGGMLYAVRLVANHFYKRDTLGLGDVKLLAAAGIWLGPQGILLAITLGAFAGLIHGVGVIGYNRLNQGKLVRSTGPLSEFSIPAGPGFAVGILCAGIYQYWPFARSVFSNVLMGAF